LVDGFTRRFCWVIDPGVERCSCQEKQIFNACQRKQWHLVDSDWIVWPRYFLFCRPIRYFCHANLGVTPAIDGIHDHSPSKLGFGPGAGNCILHWRWNLATGEMQFQCHKEAAQYVESKKKAVEVSSTMSASLTNTDA